MPEPRKRKQQEPTNPAQKLFSSVELVLVRKDLSAIWNRKGIRALLMAMPAVICIVIPLAYFAAISLLPVAEGAKTPETLQALLPGDSAQHEYRQFWMDAFTSLLCPLLYLTVPIICAVASASCVFVGEKEGGTLETLFLSSVSAKSIFHAKITACVLISVFISLISFVIFAITISVADILISAPYFFSVDWLVTVVLLMPVLSLFSVVFVSTELKRVKNVSETLQTMGYLIFPFVAAFLIQFTGVFKITALMLLIFTVLLAVASIILFNISARRFNSVMLLSSDKKGERGQLDRT